ncbi:MAG: hypothetical protein DDG60_12215 [Anaerolineae bacterium]|nr:MAG: hypothetical protein DDG60_12215 [Anaerolineae bacterium]
MKALLALKAARELGWTAVLLNALYKLGVRSGYFRLQECPKKQPAQASTFRFLFEFPSRQALQTVLGEEGLKQLRSEAQEILQGQYRPFGNKPVALNLKPTSQRHWTACETANAFFPFSDIKLLWEPARFGWAFTLGRAFHASGEERYAQAFWRYFEGFQAANPPYFGENWLNGQEVAIRLMAFVWAGQAFANAQASTPERMAALTHAVTCHALRIVPTLLYARSQNNNHLLTEAAALYTAALALPGHPASTRWRNTGLKWLNWCFEHQIDSDGEYIQHSTNYHRLMLQVALWIVGMRGHALQAERQAPEKTEQKRADALHGFSILTRRSRENLNRAADWLLSLLDPFSGRVPNLGPNDGAYLFPLTSLPFEDFRPVAYTAARVFLGQALKPGTYDEMGLWFGLCSSQEGSTQSTKQGSLAPQARAEKPAALLPILRSFSGQSWAYLRTAQFRSRPGHADLLHLDLWWRGWNITLDPGTFHYNAPAPWDNLLTHARFHNTITIDDADLFTRAGRFLYLDWRTVRCTWQSTSAAQANLSASHDAYQKRFGITHERQVAAAPAEIWTVTDTLRFAARTSHRLRLHWLLPDWEWKIGRWHLATEATGFEMRLKSPSGWLTLQIRCNHPQQALIGLLRAGEMVWTNRIARDFIHPTGYGWFSPTYSLKKPALSLVVEVESEQTMQFQTQFLFPTADTPS